MTHIISAELLKQQLNDENLVLLDASIVTTTDKNDSDYEWLTIAGARPFDIKGAFSDKSSSFPNTFPTEVQFEVGCRKLGINNSSKIVVFDNKGIYTSPRAWWLFKTMGHEDIAVLNGGLPEWINKGYETEILKEVECKLGDFQCALDRQFVKSYDDVLNNLTTDTFTIVDARSEGRFDGTAKEPRKHLQSGHIDQSINIPYTDLLENGKFKSTVELRRIFEEKCTTSKDLVFSCGSGITACIVLMACDMSYENYRNVFDGSWTEWAERQKLTIPFT